MINQPVITAPTEVHVEVTMSQQFAGTLNEINTKMLHSLY